MSRETGPFQRGTLALGALGLLLLTAGVFWYQFSRIGGGADPPRWESLRWEYLAVLLLCLPIETLTCGLRTWVMGGIRFWTCIKAEWANVAISILTPTQSGGVGDMRAPSREGLMITTVILMGGMRTCTMLGSSSRWP